MTRVLVVDDDEDIRELVSAALERGGCDVQSVPDVKSARAALDTEEFDALVTDVNLPDGNGRSLLEQGRSSRLRFAAVMTGNGSGSSESRRAGFDAHLAKPVDLSDLLARLYLSLARP